MTDTPNVNPLMQDQPIRPRTPARGQTGEATDNLKIDAGKQTVTGPENARVFIYEGNVDARIGTYRLQADKVTVFEAANRVVAEGNVVFDQADQQRITGSRAEWNYRTKTGFFVDSTGFTNQTDDGTRIYFTADRIEKISLDTLIAINAQITACEEDVPKWSFHAKRAKIKTGDRVQVYSPNFRIKNVPILYSPYLSVSLKRDRASGFLTPTFGGSGEKGFRVSTAYYQTLGRSADVTLRNDIYFERGIGVGADLRTRANSRSFFNAGFYAVKDRILGPSEDASHPDQGGSSFYAEGVHYFPNGFIAAADVNITSNLAFRQVFSDSIQQAISPEERSQVFVNKDHEDFSFNFLARTQVTSLPTSRIRIRELPSITIEKRASPLSFLKKKLPVYFSFEGGVEGVSRKETVEDLAAFRLLVGGEPIITPSLVQRLDFHPRVSVPVSFSGFSITATAAARATFYSNSLDPTNRSVLSTNLTRGYGEFELDFRPPALARDFRHRNGAFFFRHLIEPYIIYRKISGINEFDRIIRFDYNDAIADTNEIEFGIANRFFTRRSTENVSGGGAVRTSGTETEAPLSSQPYEALTITVRGKYFFDRFFGGALIPGQRNQFYPINTFSGFTYGGIPRRFSPLNIEARYRPRNDIFVDVRTDLDTRDGGLRALSTTFGINRALIQAFQSFYYTRAIELVGTDAQFANAVGNEPGTLRGSQWSPAIFLGDRNRGLYGGASFFFDFQTRPGTTGSSLISSTITAGYTWDCCAVTAQYFTFDVGVRQENRVVFSFRLNGIGTFGTEQIGQRFQ